MRTISLYLCLCVASTLSTFAEEEPRAAPDPVLVTLRDRLDRVFRNLDPKPEFEVPDDRPNMEGALIEAIKQAVKDVDGSVKDQQQGMPAILHPPITLDEYTVWRDGGTIGYRLSDADGNHLTFCIDGKVGSPTKGSFFLGVTHADQQGAQKLDRGAGMEDLLMSYLQCWLEGSFSREQIIALRKDPDAKGLSKQQRNAIQISAALEEWPAVSRLRKASSDRQDVGDGAN